MKHPTGKHATRNVGLARTISKLGYCSRSRAAELIRAGRVRVNGEVHRDPETPVSGDLAQIAVDGKLIQTQEKIYLVLNKPRGVVTTAADEKGRETVYDLLNHHSVHRKNQKEAQPWVAPVGRLDKASEGLLLLTNDSEWAARITAPETHLDKTYHVQVGTVADSNFIQTLLRGVTAREGEILRAKDGRLLRAGEKNCWLEIVLDEGKNRHIRRMMEALDIKVLRLVRVAIGPLQLSDLVKGQHRALAPDEKRMLDRAMREKSL
jgi:23S rRNA pseudouridine2605 synthase